ncbi:DUF6875 domain-containing protein [Nocardia terpenica]|uniref:DUF6875 domain-containing protein n=1 Tax=Nocardia terpenica TaxID=455432 RepID=UPI0018E07694|nr:hypothetical protein [Nocardia terpenica]
MLVHLDELEGELAATFDEWLTGYIEKPHPDLGRNGAICPFVRPARLASGLRAYRYHWLAGGDLGDMLQIFDTAMYRYRQEDFGELKQTLRGLVVVISGLPPRDYELIDRAHADRKGDAIANGMMLGQFHPECPAPAAHNERFLVNQAPFAALAVRDMAFHDILFLNHVESWFLEYRGRFGHFYDGNKRVDPHFRTLFDAAEARLAHKMEVG